MLRTAIAALLMLAVGAAAGWLWLARSGRAESDGVLVDWRPSLQLAPGVSVREGKADRFGPWRLVDLSVDPHRAQLRVARRPIGGRLEEMIPPGAVAAVNGGYFDPAFHPTGWLVDAAVDLAPRQNRSSGGVLAVHGGDLFIGPLAELPFAPDFAVQNTPRLIEDGKLGIHSDDGKRAARTVACDAEGRLHLVVITAPSAEGPTLLATARLLVQPSEVGGLGCQEALNLDGGPSTGIWLAPAAGIMSSAPAVRIAYGIAVVPL